MDDSLGAGSPAASLLETNIFFNSVISGTKEGSRFISCDLKDFFYVPPCTIDGICPFSIANK